MFSSLKTRFILGFAAFICISLIAVSAIATISIIKTAEQFTSIQGEPVV